MELSQCRPQYSFYFFIYLKTFQAQLFFREIFTIKGILNVYINFSFFTATLNPRETSPFSILVLAQFILHKIVLFNPNIFLKKNLLRIRKENLDDVIDY